MFAATDVGEVWGVGRKTQANLAAAGVKSVLDFVRCDPATLRRQFNVVIEKTLRELQGVPCIEITTRRQRGSRFWFLARLESP